jgi:hypothetical protein
MAAAAYIRTCDNSSAEQGQGKENPFLDFKVS